MLIGIFTPNSDGFIDGWKVVNDAGDSFSKVFVFLRLGKLLKPLKPSSRRLGWNKALVADGHWFLVVKDPGSGAIKEYSGNFSLIR